MKKRLLITSIVMMLVVAVALSTATYAWFTSNASVSASSISLTAATNTAEALGIGWGASDAEGAVAGTEIIANVTGVLVPMAPKSLETGVTLFSGEGGIDFNSATIKNIDSKPVFNAPNDDVNGLTFNNGSGTDTFFVKNLSTANSVSAIWMRATIEAQDYILVGSNETAAVGYTYYERSGEAAPYTYTALDPQPAVGESVTQGLYKKAADGTELVRIAVFQKTNGSYKLIGVMSNTAGNAVYGTIANNAFADVNEQADTVNGTSYAASPMHNYSTTAADTGFNLGQLGVLASHDIAVYVWLDGAALTDVQQGYGAKVSFTFTKD